MKKKDYSKEQIKNIRDYENTIESLKNFIEAVQTMPTMYIGHKSSKGYMNMFREVFQNSIDEVMRSKSPCDHVMVTIDENTCGVVIEDNGRGIPFSKIVDIYSTNHTSSNYHKEEGCGEYTSGTHGVGAKVTNALSSKFVVESYVLGEARRVEFDHGELWEEGIKEIPNKEGKQGTIVSFFPNFDIMGNIELHADEVLELIKAIVPLTVLGTKVTFKAVTTGGKLYSEEIVNTDGINGFLNDLTDKSFIQTVGYADDNGTTRANILFTYDSDDLESERICGFSNFCPCTGSHVDGFLDAITTFFRNYMNKIYLASSNAKKKKQLTVVGNDIKAGLRAIIDVAHINPTFTGQAKEILTNNDVQTFVKELTLKHLEVWVKNNPADLQKLCKRFKEVAEVRVQSENGRQKISMKYKNTISGLPPKFIKPSSKDWKELIICEGDSAKGSMENNRDNKTQGVFPVRGKGINCITNSMDKVLANEEVKAIISILGGGYGKNFDISKVRFERVILATDADTDGSHIANLLLGIFLTFMPEMIKQGRVYKVVPPLYRVGIGDKSRFFFDKVDYMSYLRDLFIKTNTLSFTKYDTKLNDTEVLNLLTVNEDYIYELNKVASTYNVDIRLLELVLMNRHMNYNDLINLIKQDFDYRFLHIETISNTLAIKGPVRGKVITLFLNDKMYSECSEIFKIMDQNHYLTYNFNGVESTLYTIMNEFKKLEPSSMQRFKGLGEMEPEELEETTVHPDGQRVLIQYTFEDAVKEIERIRYLSNNKGELLKDIKVSRNDIF